MKGDYCDNCGQEIMLGQECIVTARAAGATMSWSICFDCFTHLARSFEYKESITEKTELLRMFFMLEYPAQKGADI